VELAIKSYGAERGQRDEFKLVCAMHANCGIEILLSSSRGSERASSVLQAF